MRMIVMKMKLKATWARAEEERASKTSNCPDILLLLRKCWESNKYPAPVIHIYKIDNVMVWVFMWEGCYKCMCTCYVYWHWVPRPICPAPTPHLILVCKLSRGHCILLLPCHVLIIFPNPTYGRCISDNDMQFINKCCCLIMTMTTNWLKG